MAKIIHVIDDEENILEIINYNLEKNGYNVKSFQNGRDFLNYFNKNKPDLVVLDLMLPDMDGFDICREIKATTNVPVLILSAKSEEFDKVLGLELGADDYVSKPFGVRELMARVKNILRRSQNQAEMIKPLKGEFIFDNVTVFIDETKHEIALEGKNIKLNPKEYKILLMLMRNIDKLVNRKELIKEVWGEDYYGDTRTLDVHIRRIREKMSIEKFGIRFIKTVHGYKIVSTD